MPERMTAVRATVADIINGNYNSEPNRHVISPSGVELRRVALVGYVVDLFSRDDFTSVTIDDGTETIRAKAWAEMSSENQIKPNSLVMLIGKVNEYNDEVYIQLEIVRELEDPNFMTMHLLERYRAIITRSGVSLPVFEPVGEKSSTKGEQSSLDTGSSTSPSASSSKPSTEPVGVLKKQLVQYIELHANPKGVDIKDIAQFFEDKGYDKQEVQRKILDLLLDGTIDEVSVGHYQPAGV